MSESVVIDWTFNAALDALGIDYSQGYPWAEIERRWGEIAEIRDRLDRPAVPAVEIGILVCEGAVAYYMPEKETRP